ncbi:MAG: hypothetical protein LIO75_07755 [Lachnospiraceae bacterium]|nr:hypothetical protein [Lachnospiraceae bacterium]
MAAENYKQKVTDLVGDETRKGTVIRNLDAMRLIPSLLETVHVSRESMKAEMNQRLDGFQADDRAEIPDRGRRGRHGRHDSGIRADDRAEAVLNAIGFRIKQDERKIWRVVSAKDKTQERLDSFLVVDEDAFRENLGQIADCLSRTEQRETEYRKSMEERVLKMSEQKEESTDSYAECRDELAFLRRAAAEQIQYILMRAGRETAASGNTASGNAASGNADSGNAASGNADSEIVQGLYDLLEVLDIEAVWEAEDESGMFTVLKQVQAGECRNKPCMMHAGEILVKGLRFDTMDTGM